MPSIRVDPLRAKSAAPARVLSCNKRGVVVPVMQFQAHPAERKHGFAFLQGHVRLVDMLLLRRGVPADDGLPTFRRD